jgi:hypothetical protein
MEEKKRESLRSSVVFAKNATTTKIAFAEIATTIKGEKSR